MIFFRFFKNHMEYPEKKDMHGILYPEDLKFIMRSRTMKKVLRGLTVLILSAGVLLLSGCSYFWPDSSFDKMDPPAVIAPSPAAYETMVVQKSTMLVSRDFTGNFLYATSNTYDLVSAPAEAAYREVIPSATVKGNEGDKVKKGAVIAQLSTEKLDAYIAECQKNYRALLQQYQSLLDEGNKDMAAEIKKDMDAAKEVYDLATADKELYTIKAPYDCVISEISKTQGAVVRYLSVKIYDPTSFSLINTNTANTMGFKVGDAGTVSFYDTATKKTVTYKAKVTAIPKTGAATGTVNSRFVAVITDEYDASLIKSGTPGTFSVVDSQKENVIMIPTSAVIDFGTGKTIVRVLDEQGITKGEKLVELGSESNGMVEVLDGLSEGDIVILN